MYFLIQPMFTDIFYLVVLPGVYCISITIYDLNIFFICTVYIIFPYTYSLSENNFFLRNYLHDILLFEITRIGKSMSYGCLGCLLLNQVAKSVIGGEVCHRWPRLS